MKRLLLFVMISTALLGACGGGGDAGAAIESYINAVVAQDMDAAQNASCGAWEASAQTEVRSFDGVTARIEGLACTASGTDGDFTVVTCEGTIIATYQGEDRPIDLAARAYLAAHEGGEFRMCGYQ
jgi:hypothetical protein